MPFGLGFFATAGAGGGAPAFDWLETTLITTNTGTVTFSNLNTYTDYKHLHFRLVLRDNANNTGTTSLEIRLNGDTATNYARHSLVGDETSVTSTNASAQDRISLVDASPGSASTASTFGTITFDLLDFASTAKTKVLRGFVGSDTANEADIYLWSALWNNTAATTSISFLPASAFLAGSRLSLYGIKG